MDPQSQAGINIASSPSPPINNKNNKLMLIAVLLLLAVLGIMIYALLSIKSAKTTSTLPQNSGEQTIKASIAPTVTGMVVPVVTSYENPFEEKTQYSNPFDENTNPFDNLK